MTKHTSLLVKVAVVLGVMAILGYGIGRIPVWASHGCPDRGDYFHIHWERTVSADVLWTYIIVDESGATGKYQPAISASITDWNNSQGHVDFIFNDDPLLAETIATVDSFEGDPLHAWMDSQPGSCQSSSTHLASADVYMNSLKIEEDINNGVWPEDVRQAISTHELGHSIGLDHPSDLNATAIMQPGWQGFNTVQQWDKDMLTAHFDPYGHSD